MKTTIADIISPEEQAQVCKEIGRLMTGVKPTAQTTGLFATAFRKVIDLEWDGSAIVPEELASAIVEEYKALASGTTIDPNAPKVTALEATINELTKERMVSLLDIMATLRLAKLGVDEKNKEAVALFHAIQREIFAGKPSGSIKLEDLPTLADELVEAFKVKWQGRGQESLAE